MTTIKCPECKSTDTAKDGWSRRKRKRVQRYVCNKCNRRFRE